MPNTSLGLNDLNCFAKACSRIGSTWRIVLQCISLKVPRINLKVIVNYWPIPSLNHRVKGKFCLLHECLEPPTRTCEVDMRSELWASNRRSLLHTLRVKVVIGVKKCPIFDCPKGSSND